MSSVADLPRRATAFCITWCGQTRLFTHSLKMEAIPVLASVGRFNQLPGVQWSRPHARSDFMARKASATCPAVTEEYPLTFWNLTASSLACLKAVASWSALLSFPCFVQCFHHASDLRDSAVRGSEPSHLLSFERYVDLGRLVSLPKDSTGTCCAVREGFVAPLFEFSAPTC